MVGIGKRKKPLSGVEVHRRRLDYVRQVAEALSQPDSLVSSTVTTYADLLDDFMHDVAHGVLAAAVAGTLDCLRVPAHVSASCAAQPSPAAATSRSAAVATVQAPGAPPAHSSAKLSAAAGAIPAALAPQRRSNSGEVADLVSCPQCTRRVAASRFSAHLEQCMFGNGRSARTRKRVHYSE